MTESSRAFSAYLKQQADLGIPDLLFSHGFLSSLAAANRTAHRPAVQHTASPAGPRTAAAQPPQPAAAPRRQTRIMSAVELHARFAGRVQAPAGSSDYDRKRELLKNLYGEMQACHACPLAVTKTRMVFGAGNAAAPVLIIGEAPGADEDKSGLPFVGKAGELLTKMLAAIELDRKTHVFITNVLKCRPPENRDPNDVEVIVCLPWLKKQLEIIQPKLVLLLGRVAAHAILGGDASLAQLRKERYEYEGIPVFVTYHPAALLHNPANKKPAWEDLKKVQIVLKEMGIYGTTD